MESSKENEFEAMCPECGKAFKVFIDRVLESDPSGAEIKNVECPACGCADCTIGT